MEYLGNRMEYSATPFLKGGGSQGLGHLEVGVSTVQRQAGGPSASPPPAARGRVAFFSDFFLSTALTLQASAELFLSGLEGR